MSFHIKNYIFNTWSRAVVKSEIIDIVLIWQIMSSMNSLYFYKWCIVDTIANDETVTFLHYYQIFDELNFFNNNEILKNKEKMPYMLFLPWCILYCWMFIIIGQHKQTHIFAIIEREQFWWFSLSWTLWIIINLYKK